MGCTLDGLSDIGAEFSGTVTVVAGIVEVLSEADGE